MQNDQELQPTYNVSPTTKRSSADAALYRQFLDEKSKQNALKRKQEEFETQSAKAQREQGWMKYVNGENRTANRKPIPSISVVRNAPTKKGAMAMPQNPQANRRKPVPSPLKLPVMPCSGPPLRSSQQDSSRDVTAESNVQRSRRRESSREKWTYVPPKTQVFASMEGSLKPGGLNPTEYTHLAQMTELADDSMASLQPGVPPALPLVPVEEADGDVETSDTHTDKTRESFFHGTATMFGESVMSYDFSAYGVDAEDPAIEGHVKEALMKQSCDLLPSGYEHKTLEDLVGTETLSLLAASNTSSNTFKQDKSYNWSASSTEMCTDSDPTASMDIPESLMILAEKMDQLPPSCFHSQENLAAHESLPPRSQSEPFNVHNEDIRPRSTIQELRQQAQDIRAALIKISTTDPKDLAEYVLNMPHDFQVKLLNMLKKGMSGDPGSLGALHHSFQQTSMLSDIGDSTSGLAPSESVSLMSTPAHILNRVKEVDNPSFVGNPLPPMNQHATLPVSNVIDFRVRDSPTSPNSASLPKQPFQPTPTPLFSKDIRKSPPSSPGSPEERPITSINQHSLQRQTLRHVTISPPDINAPGVDICVVPNLVEGEKHEHMTDDFLQECLEKYAQKHSCHSYDSTSKQPSNYLSNSGSLPINEDDSTTSKDDFEPITPQKDVNHILQMEEAFMESHANRRFSAKPLLSSSRRESGNSEGKLPNVLYSPSSQQGSLRQARPQSHRTSYHQSQAITSLYGSQYLGKVRNTEKPLPILLFKFVSTYNTVSSIAVRKTMLPNIIQNENCVIYTAEYLSTNSGVWKTRQRRGDICIVDAVPTQKDPIYIYLSGMYLLGTPQYSISQETRRTREAVLIPQDLVASLYEFYLSAAESYCRQHMQAHAYEKTIRDLQKLLPNGPYNCVSNSSMLRKNILELSSTIAKDAGFRTATCIETHRFTSPLPATSLGSATDLLINLLPFHPSGSSNSPSRSSTQCRRLRINGSAVNATAVIEKSDRTFLYDRVTIEVLSNYGDSSFVGLSALQFYDSEGIEISPFYDAISGPDSCTTAAYISKEAKISSFIPAGSIYNLLNFECRTIDADKMWTVRRALAKPITITVTIPVTRRVSAMRIWNYNKSPTSTDQGARRILVKLNNTVVADTDIKKATGTLSDCCLNATLITFNQRNREYVDKLLARDRYRDIIAEERLAYEQLVKIGEVPYVNFTMSAYNQKLATSASCCPFGRLATSTLSLMVTSMYGDNAKNVSLGNIMIIDQNNTVLVPRKVQVHGSDTQHVVRGYVMTTNEKVVRLVPEFSLEQSCYTGAVGHSVALPNENAQDSERAVADALDEPLWMCSINEASSVMKEGKNNNSEEEDDRSLQNILKAPSGLGITVWFRVGGTIAEDGSIVPLSSNVQEKTDGDYIHSINNIVMINTAGDQSANIKYALLFVNSSIWTPLPGVFIRPNCFINYFTTLTISLKGLLNKIAVIIRGMRARKSVEEDNAKATDIFVKLYENIDKTAIIDTPAFIEPQIMKVVKSMHNNILFGQWISLGGPVKPSGAAELCAELAQYGDDNDAIFIAVHAELMKRAERIKEFKAGMSYGAGKCLEQISTGSMVCTQGQLTYISQRLVNTGQHLSYISLSTPRGYILTINVLSRYPAQSRHRPNSTRKTEEVSSGQANGTKLHTSFSLGLGSIIVCDSAHTPIDFSKVGCGVYSTIMSQQLIYDLRVYKNVNSNIIVSDSSCPARNLLKSLPWEVRYDISLTTASNTKVEDCIEDLIKRLGTSRSDGMLVSLHFTSSSPIQVSAIILTNNKIADVSISLDSMIVFEGRLKNIKDPQIIAFCRNKQQYKMLDSVDINDEGIT